MEGKDVLFAFRLPQELDDRCRITAATRRISRSEFHRQATEFYLTWLESPEKVVANHEPEQAEMEVAR